MDTASRTPSNDASTRWRDLVSSPLSSEAAVQYMYTPNGTRIVLQRQALKCSPYMIKNTSTMAFESAAVGQGTEQDYGPDISNAELERVVLSRLSPAQQERYRQNIEQDWILGTEMIKPTDAPISRFGYAQLRNVRAQVDHLACLTDLSPSMCIASPLTRCIETHQAMHGEPSETLQSGSDSARTDMADHSGCPLIVTQWLRELCNGEQNRLHDYTVTADDVALGKIERFSDWDIGPTDTVGETVLDQGAVIPDPWASVHKETHQQLSDRVKRKLLPYLAKVMTVIATADHDPEHSNIATSVSLHLFSHYDTLQHLSGLLGHTQTMSDGTSLEGVPWDNAELRKYEMTLNNTGTATPIRHDDWQVQVTPTAMAFRLTPMNWDCVTPDMRSSLLHADADSDSEQTRKFDGLWSWLCERNQSLHQLPGDEGVNLDDIVKV